MTDHFAVNRALALAIGWKPEDLDTIYQVIEIRIPGEFEEWVWRTFDYRDPAIIWPIALRFDCFPKQQRTSMHTTQANDSWYADVGQVRSYADTAELAVALAVIRAHGGVV